MTLGVLLAVGFLAWTCPFEIARKDGRPPAILTYVLWSVWAAAVILAVVAS